MPSPLQDVWTIKKLLQNTYMHKENRFDYKDRDVLKGVRVREVTEYALTTRKKRTKFIIESFSYPQYGVYTPPPTPGAQKQRSWKHEYDVTIQVDRLSINAPVKLRTGSDRPWDFSPAGRSRRDGNRVIEGTNVINGVNGDHFFRLSFIRKEAGILFGRNYATQPPVKRNPKGIQFLTKHELRCIEDLMNQGILKDD